MNTDLRLRSISLSTFATLCVGVAVSCSGSGGAGNFSGVGGGVVLETGNKGGSSATGGSNGTTTGTSTGTGATGTSTNPGTGNPGTPGAGGTNNTTTSTDPGTENSHNCSIPLYVDQQDALITDFKNTACAGGGLYCYGSGGGVAGAMSAPASQCAGSSLTPSLVTEGMVLTGTITGPTVLHFSFSPCAYVHFYNSIQSLIVNRSADLSIAVAMNTIETSPPEKGGTCTGACADPNFTKVVPGRAGGSENVLTWPFDYMMGAQPPITYYRNQVVGVDMIIAPNTSCGTATVVDLTIKHVYFYNAPI